MKKKCLICKKVYDGIKSQKFCSRACYYKEMSRKLQENPKKNPWYIHGKAPRIRVKERLRELRKEQKRKVMKAYGGRCVCCDETAIEFLSIDHIGGGGNKHRKSLGIRNIYPWLIKNKFPKGFRILCMNCNTSRGFYGYCPHESENQIRQRIMLWSEQNS